MFTVNGKNKLERQINKAFKYLEIKLSNLSNKYLEIEEFNKENTFIAIDNSKIVKNGELLVISPINLKDKVIFKPKWATLIVNNYYNNYQNYVIFQEKNPEQLKVLNELANGYDDIYRLDDFLKKQKIQIEKN